MATTKKSKEKKLDITDHIGLEKLPLEVERVRLTMAVEEQSLRNMVLESQLLTEKIEKQKRVVANLGTVYENKKSGLLKFRQELFEKYGIKDEQLSYDNNTGIIV